MNSPMSARVAVATNKAAVPDVLNSKILQIAHDSIEARGSFSIALSGGSLAAFLSNIADASGPAPRYDCWHVLLADERCVPKTDGDSNLGSLTQSFLSKVPIPTSQIHGIDESKLEGPLEELTIDYEGKVKAVLEKSGGLLDLAVLGFGPDGHTCSLFPGHLLLQERTKLVAWIDDSPKPPPKRITLTYRVLNDMTRHVIFCGAGASKGPILKAVFATVTKTETESILSATMSVPPPYPCAMVQPTVKDSSVTWVVDADAVKDL